MEKVQLAKIVNLNNQQKIVNNRVNLELPNDKFIKKELSMDKEKYINKISDCDFDSITNKLVKLGKWSDGLNMIAFNTTNGKISSVSIATPELGATGNNVDIISIKDFVDIMTNITAHNIKNNPEKETLYKTGYVSVLKHLNENKYNK